MENVNVLYYGKKEDLQEPIHLKAGNLDINYKNGFLRYIRLGDIEVLRMIYFAVRDQNWDTIEGKIRDEKIKINKNSFDISYISEHSRADIDIIFNCKIEGSEAGAISFTIDGVSNSSFLKNRIGFCVLHPVNECIGKPCTIEHWNGEISTDPFPELISPHQPFTDIRTMKWEPGDDIKAVLNFEGDVFEAEDQRNWTDASYKTYCTPLDIPFPVKLEKGSEIKQKIVLGISYPDDHSVNLPKNSEKYVLSVEEKSNSYLPLFGTSESSFYDLPDQHESDLIKNLELDHLRVEIDLDQEDISLRADKIFELSQRYNLPLMLVIFVSKDPVKEYSAFSEYFEKKKNALLENGFPGIKYIILFDKALKTTSFDTIDRLSSMIRSDFPEADIGAGTNIYFTELNRERVDPENLDFLTWSINPQVHAFDIASLTETLEAQSYTVDSAREMARDKDVIVSPVTLKPRFNPNATGPEPEPSPDELPPQVDERQMSLYGACWTLGSIKYLAESGVKVVTYYETSGWRGLLQGNKPSPLPEKFHAESSDVFPLYYIFDWLRKFNDAEIVKLKSSDPLVFDGIGFSHNNRINMFVSNFTGEKVELDIAGVNPPFLLLSMDEDNVNVFRKDPATLDQKPSDEVDKIILKPFSINWISSR